MQLFAVNFIFLEDHSTRFVCCPRPSSGVQKTVTTASGTGHIIGAATFFQRGQLATLEEGSCNDHMTCTGGCSYRILYS